MKALIDVGNLSIDLDPLIKRVKAIPLTEWNYRTDRESNKTCSLDPIKYRDPELKNLVNNLLAEVERLLNPGYHNRVFLSCVPAGEEILPHIDDFGEEVRATSIHCHIPLITHTNSKLGFSKLKEEYNLEVGRLYIMDESQEHYVINNSPVDRIHLLLAHFPHNKDIQSLTERI